MDKLKVEGINVVKDLKSSALLNCDNDKLLAYKNAKRMRLLESERIKNLEEDVSSIKQMLKVIIDKLG